MQSGQDSPENQYVLSWKYCSGVHVEDSMEWVPLPVMNGSLEWECMRLERLLTCVLPKSAVMIWCLCSSQLRCSALDGRECGDCQNPHSCAQNKSE